MGKNKRGYQLGNTSNMPGTKPKGAAPILELSEFDL